MNKKLSIPGIVITVIAVGIITYIGVGKSNNIVGNLEPCSNQRPGYEDTYCLQNHQVYFLEKLVAEANPNTFQTNLENDYYGYWGKDDRNAFYYGQKVESLDPDTLVILNGGSNKDMGFGSYVRDKNHVYYGNSIIDGADPASFEFIYGYVEFHAQDKNHKYLRGVMVQ